MSKITEFISDWQENKAYQELTWEGGVFDYLQIVEKNPRVARSAFQRIYDMVLGYCYEEYYEYKKKIIHYRYFEDLIDDGRDALFGLDLPLMKLVHIFQAAARRYGPEKRIILLHGPVGGAKSTIVRLLKKGIEAYSRTPEGALYSFSWLRNGMEDKRNIFGSQDEILCPMHEDPLVLVPREIREKVLAEINENLPEEERLNIAGEPCPSCRFISRELTTQYIGDWLKAMKHVKVRRILLSEKDRIGIGTFQPKDEKNQDSTELTGDINYRKIAEYGSDSDPRAFNFDGEFNIANRGIIEFIEVLKLDVAFLYDLLGASQEHKVKPKKFPQTDIDEVIIGHTNEPEYRKLQNNEFMEALRDRTIKIDIPYITEVSEEVKIYKKDFSPHRVKAKHIAPHTLELAALWAVLTRLELPKKTNLTLLQKLKLYDGRRVTGYTSESIKELKREAKREGLQGISPRYVQDKISNVLVSSDKEDQGCVNAFQLLQEFLGGLDHNSLINNEEQKKIYEELLGVARQEYEDILKTEVQRAVSADEESLGRLCSNYIDNVKAYIQR